MKNLQKDLIILDESKMAALHGGTLEKSPVYSVAYFLSYGVTWFVKTTGRAYDCFYPLIFK
ncbi:MAG: hypothetical protein ACP5E3_15700 [Bacteroidales bacterium]